MKGKRIQNNYAKQRKCVGIEEGWDGGTGNKSELLLH
jgi:hypothetical protein